MMKDVTTPADIARRLREERAARGMSQREAVQRLRMYSPDELPSEESLIRTWKRWEAGDHLPDVFYRPLIAKLFGTVTAAFFPESNQERESAIIAASGMSTMEIISKVRGSTIDNATLDALRITADRLCSEYSYMPSDQLMVEGQQWLRRITDMLNRRLTLAQHREVLSLAGLIALLVGCVENDMGNRMDAEATRRSALDLGTDADDRRVMGWAHEMSAWFALTDGNYTGVIAASNRGIEAAGDRDVSVQLIAQKAKAYARVGDTRLVTITLEEGRQLLERQPYPEDVTNHFSVDPAKWDFYAMDCYRVSGQDELAKVYADEVLRVSTDASGQNRAPMRSAEARITLAVAAARDGDLSTAIEIGEHALEGDRKSIPSLLMVSRDLERVVTQRYPNAPDAREYVDHLRALGRSA
jgi:transcriptional regulator with XRE-family HTH domain